MKNSLPPTSVVLAHAGTHPPILAGPTLSRNARYSHVISSTSKRRRRISPPNPPCLPCPRACGDPFPHPGRPHPFPQCSLLTCHFEHIKAASKNLTAESPLPPVSSRMRGPIPPSWPAPPFSAMLATHMSFRAHQSGVEEPHRRIPPTSVVLADAGIHPHAKPAP